MLAEATGLPWRSKTPASGAGFGDSVAVSGSTISGNTSESIGGGISVGDYAELEVSGSTISGNTSDVDGGGIAAIDRSSAYVADSSITGNSATSSTSSRGYGGGIYAGYFPRSLTVTGSTVSGNKTTNTGSDGGKLSFEYLFVDAPGKPSDYQLVYETPSRVITVPLEFEFKDIVLP